MHHHIQPHQAHVIRNDMPSRPVYQVYRPDGLWAKLVAEYPVEEGALARCRREGWEVIR